MIDPGDEKSFLIWGWGDREKSPEKNLCSSFKDANIRLCARSNQKSIFEKNRRERNERRHQRFCWNCPSSTARGKQNASGAIWKLAASSITPCFRRGKNGFARCELIPIGRWHAPSHIHTHKPDGRLSPRFENATASRSMHSIRRPVPCASDGSLIIWTRYWLKHLPAAPNRVCVGKAKRVRFKSRGRGLGSIENKRNDTGLRFVLQKPEEGNRGYLQWRDDQLEAVIDWDDPVVAHGLKHRVKYARLLQRKASSERAQGADTQGWRYSVQLALEGVPHQKKKHTVGHDIIGADLGPSSIALVPREGEASLQVFCEELAPDQKAIRSLQRKMDRQRRAANPDNYDEKGRSKKGGKKNLSWKTSKSYQRTRQRKAEKERKLAAHRKSLHGKKVHEIVAKGNTVILEKISYKAWQKHYGKSVGLRAPGMFVDILRRTVASTGGTLLEVPTRTSKLSQFCHGCGKCVKKPLSQRMHHCSCGVGPVQRDLYSAFLASTLAQDHLSPSCAQAVVRLRKCGGALAGCACTGHSTRE